MEALTTLTAVAAPIVADNVDTDQIFPARFISKDRRDGGYAAYFLHDHRFDDEGRPKSDCVLNDPRFSSAKILVAGANYASGSGRPGAIFSHLDFGVRAIIAESFGPVFSAVAYKSGLLTVALARASIVAITRQILESPGREVTVDLGAQTVVAPDGTAFSFDIDHFVKRMIMEGRSEIDLTLTFEDKISATEAALRRSLPWVFQEPKRQR